MEPRNGDISLELPMLNISWSFQLHTVINSSFALSHFELGVLSFAIGNSADPGYKTPQF
jgi:hypothetical protein